MTITLYDDAPSPGGPLLSGGLTLFRWMRFHVSHQRRARLPGWEEASGKSDDALNGTLRNDGHAILPKFFGEAVIDKVRSDARPLFKRHGSAADDGTKNYQLVDDPIYHCPSILPLIFSLPVIAIASRYLGCLPGLTNVILRKSFVTQSAPSRVHQFHCDTQNARFLKFFIYLNDTDIDGGPFCYVHGSHRNKDRFWWVRDIWSDERVKAMVGEDAIRSITGSTGDLIVADTTGLHKGIKPRKRSRMILSMSYGVHAHSKRAERPRIRREDFESLSPLQQKTADWLNVV